jgi:hypothetical protein
MFGLLRLLCVFQDYADAKGPSEAGRAGGLRNSSQALQRDGGDGGVALCQPEIASHLRTPGG